MSDKTKDNAMIKNPKYNAYYFKLRRKIAKWLEDKRVPAKVADVILLAPDLFYLLCRLILDPRVGTESKALLGLAITYFISPVDLMPEIILGPVGYLDDIAVTVFVLNRLLKSVPAEILREHWAGKADILEVIADVMERADGLVGSGMWKRIKKMFDKKEQG